MAALLVLFREVWDRELPWLDGLVRANVPPRRPLLRSRAGVWAVLSHMDGVPRPMATLMNGAGLRLLEVCRLRGTMLPSIARPVLIATQLLEDDPDIRTAKDLLGRADVSTTKIYTHVLNRGPAGVRRTADRLLGDGGGDGD